MILVYKDSYGTVPRFQYEIIRYGTYIINFQRQYNNCVAASLDKVPEPADHPEAEVAAAAEDIPAAGEDAASRPNEHQRGHLGPPTQEEHQPHQERGPRVQGARQLRQEKQSWITRSFSNETG